MKYQRYDRRVILRNWFLLIGAKSMINHVLPIMLWYIIFLLYSSWCRDQNFSQNQLMSNFSIYKTTFSFQFLPKNRLGAFAQWSSQSLSLGLVRRLVVATGVSTDVGLSSTQSVDQNNLCPSKQTPLSHSLSSCRWSVSHEFLKELIGGGNNIRFVVPKVYQWICCHWGSQ